MSRSNLFYAFIVLTALFTLGAIYYILPGFHHVLATHSPNDPQIKHFIGLGAIAIVCLIVAVVNRPKAVNTTSSSQPVEAPAPEQTTPQA